MNLTDEQFREARRQILERLRAQAVSATNSAKSSIGADCRNFQNHPSPFAGEWRDRARAYNMVAEAVALMERDGFDYSG